MKELEEWFTCEMIRRGYGDFDIRLTKEDVFQMIESHIWPETIEEALKELLDRL